MENAILQALAQMEERINRKIDDLRNELKSEINDVRTEVNELRTEVNDLRTEVNELRTEMNRRFDEIEERQTELIARHVRKAEIKFEAFKLDFQALTHRVEKLELVTKELL